MNARLLRWIVPLLVVLLAGVALADSRVEFLAQHLKYPPPDGVPDDPRVRTSAALNLGATNDDAAVEPLCGGLSDPSGIVRHASAAALKRLGRSAGLPCLKQRLDQEGDESVKVQIQRSIEAIEGGGPPAAGGGVPAGTHFYVAIGPTTNNTSRPRGEIDGIVQSAIRGKLQSLGGYAFAPPGESPATARSVISGNSLTGYYLAPLVNRFDYSGGSLHVTVKLAVFTYPGRDFKGDAQSNGSQDGVQQGDKQSENDVLQAVMQGATEHFAGGFH